MLTRRWCAVIAVVAAVSLSGCAARSPVVSSGAAPAPSAGTGTSGRVASLIGLWQLTAPGEAPGTVLRLAAGDLSIWRPCSIYSGGWAADADGTLVADFTGFSYGCSGPKPTAGPKPDLPRNLPPDPTWLRTIASFRADGVDRLLLDRSGATVAKLAPGGKPIPNRNVAAELSAPPVLDAAARRWLEQGRPLPATLRPARAADLLGTWYPEGTVAGVHRPFFRFAADGSMTGSDGCNSRGGRWAVASGGNLLTLSGVSTLIGCAGQDKVPSLGAARRVGLLDKNLVLLDAAGTELGRLGRG